MKPAEAIALQVAERNRHIRNRWYGDDTLEVYVRYAAVRSIPGHGHRKMLDLANFVVAPQHRRKGILKQFLTDIEALVDSSVGEEYDGVYIENVLEKHLYDHLEQRGYIKIEADVGPWPPSFYRPRNQ